MAVTYHRPSGRMGRAGHESMGESVRPWREVQLVRTSDSGDVVGDRAA